MSTLADRKRNLGRVPVKWIVLAAYILLVLVSRWVTSADRQPKPELAQRVETAQYRPHQDPSDDQHHRRAGFGFQGQAGGQGRQQPQPARPQPTYRVRPQGRPGGDGHGRSWRNGHGLDG